MKYLMILGLFLGLVSSVFARRNYISSDSVMPIITQVIILGPGQSIQGPVLKIDVGENRGLDWDTLPVTGTVSVNVIFLQSNQKVGPYTTWASLDLTGVTNTNNVTITSNQGGSSLVFSHSAYTRPLIINTASNTVTINWLALFNQ